MTTETIDQEYLTRIGMTGRYEQIHLVCEICERDEFEQILRKGKVGKAGEYGPINVVQCAHCGHVMVNPRFEPRFYVDYYRTFYKDNVAAQGGSKPSKDTVDRQESRGRKCMEFIARESGLKSGRMLDLGCGYGSTMLPFRDAGWEVHGIDPEEEAVEFARQDLNLDVVYGFAEELPYPDAYFDLIISLGALEHVYDFDASMRELARVLKPGGRAFIRARHNRPWGLIWEYYNRNHYRFFCGRTHKLALARYGFELDTYSDEQVEGRNGDRYMICRRTKEPSLDRVNELVDAGVRDSPAELRGYLREHHGKIVDRAQALLKFEKDKSGDHAAMAKDIIEGRFEHTLLLAYFEPAEAVARALLEARRLIEESADDGIVDA